MLAGLALGLAGCDQSDSSYADEIGEARDMMLTMSVATEDRQSEIQAVISKLNSAMGSVDGEAKGPAQLMLARANSSLAEIELRAAREISSRISLDLVRADAVAREYSSDRAFARTLVGPDATEAIRAIESDIREIDAEIRELESRKQGLSGELATVQNEIAQLMESARAERLQEATLRDESLDAEPMRRAELIEQAAKRARAAEAYEKTAAERELTVDSLGLAIDQVEGIIESQQDLRGIQTQGLERISRVDGEINQRRAAREAETRRSLEEYRAALDSVVETYRSEFLPTVESAASGFSNAASTARQARSMGNLASAASGEHAAAAARTHELRAHTAQRIAASAAYLVSISASEVSRYESIRSEFTQQADEAFGQAAEAYSEAADALSRAGGDIGASLSERYQARARELRGEPAPDDTGADGSMPDDGLDG
jgi:hypothetical protein